MSNVTYNGTLIGTASIAETVLPSGLPPAFTDVSITPSSASPYEISATDVGARLVVNSTSDDPIVNFLSSNTSSIPVGSRVQVAAFGRYCALNSTVAIGSPDLFFDPNANGTVNTLAIQSDGKIVIGGAFTTVGGTTRTRIARLNSDGTLDTSVDPSANNEVSALAIRSDGKVVIGGFFTTVGSATRNRVALLGGYVGNVSGGDSIYAPYALPTGGSPTLPRYAVLTLEKIAAGEWVVTESNVS